LINFGEKKKKGKKKKRGSEETKTHKRPRTLNIRARKQRTLITTQKKKKNSKKKSDNNTVPVTREPRPKDSPFGKAHGKDSQHGPESPIGKKDA